MNILPMQINEILNTFVSIQRIQKFLEEEDVPDWVSTLYKNSSNDSQQTKKTRKIDDLPFGCDNATFTWARNKSNAAKEIKPSSASFLSRVSAKLRLGKKRNAAESQPLLDDAGTSEPASEDRDQDLNNPPFQLKNISLSFPRGKMTLIAGPTSSGKSSLLNALLGEMDLVSGTVHLPKDVMFRDPETGLSGAVAFCSQQPWLQQCSIKDNILFGSQFEVERYNQVLEAAGESGVF